MKIDPTQIYFGFNTEKDRKSLSLFLQLLGRPEFTEHLASRMNSDEIDAFVDQLSVVLHKHISESEYHKLFLQREHSH